MPAREPPTLDGAKDYRERYEELSGCSLWQCPVCHKGRMLAIEILPRNHSRQAAITDTYEEDCYEMQIKLLRASLAEPSGRNSVAKRVISEKIRGTDLIPPTPS